MRDTSELVRHGYTALNAGDIGTLSLLLDEDACWHTPGRSPIAGDYVGRDAVLGLFARFGAAGLRAELRHVTAADGRVVGIHRTTGRRSGRRLDVGCCTVFEFRHGRIADGRAHVFDLHAWDAFWS